MRQRAPPPPTGCVPLLFCCHLLRRPLLSVHVLPVRDLHVSSGRVGVSGDSGEFAGLPARLRTLLLLNLAPRPSGHGCSPTPTARAPFAAAAVAARTMRSQPACRRPNLSPCSCPCRVLKAFVDMIAAVVCFPCRCCCGCPD